MTQMRTDWGTLWDSARRVRAEKIGAVLTGTTVEENLELLAVIAGNTTGPQGPPGTPGNTVLYGTTDPTSAIGVDGNFYINTTTNHFFGPRAGGVWPAGTSLVGPQGPPGPEAVSTDASNAAILGSDGLVYVPQANTAPYTLSTGTVARSNNARFSDQANYLDHGGIADYKSVTGLVTIASGSAAVQITNGVFVAGDVGKNIVIANAGATSAALYTTILAVNSSTNITLATAASTAVSGVSCIVPYGTDNAAAFAAAVNYVVANNKTLYIPTGVYFFAGVMLVMAGLRAVADPQATFMKCFTTSGASALLTSATPSTVKVSNIKWRGGLFKAVDNTIDAYNGDMISFYGDDIILFDVSIDTYGGPTGGGIAMVMNGDRIKVYNPIIINPAPHVGNGGIRVTGGDQFQCIGGYVSSGDIALQFVPSIRGLTGVTPAPIADNNITNGSYIGTLATSFGTAVIEVGVGNQAANVGSSSYQTCQASVTDCAFVSIKGAGAVGRSAELQNTDSSGKIARIVIAECSFGGSVASSGNLACLYLLAWMDGGGIEDVTFRDCSVLSPDTTAVQVTGNRSSGPSAPQNQYNVRNFQWIGGRIDNPPTTSSDYTVKMFSVQGGVFRDVALYAGPNDAVQMGSGTAGPTNITGCNNFTFDNCTFNNMQNGQYGIRNTIGGNIVVRGCRFVGAAGTTNALAAYFNANAYGGTNRRIEDCDMSLLTGPGTNLISNGGPAMGDSIARCNGYTGYQDSDLPYAAVKPADTTVTSNNTMANDPDLQITAPANGIYQVTAYLQWNQGASVAGGIQFNITNNATAGSTWGYSINEASIGSLRQLAGSLQSSTAINERVMLAQGILSVSTTPVIMNVQWAQSTASTTPTILRKNSSLIATKIA